MKKVVKWISLLILSLIIPMLVTSVVFYQAYSRTVNVSLILANIDRLNEEAVASRFMELSQDTSQAAEAVELLLTIVGIAVSVWLGLNIYNVISREELKDIEERTKSYEEKTKELENQTKEVNKAIVIENLSRTAAYYPPSQHIADRIKGISKGFVENKVLAIMSEVEMLFTAVSSFHRKSDTSNQLLYSIHGIEKCEKMKESFPELPQEASDTIKGYCHLRLGEFYFYQGYRRDVKISKDAIEELDTSFRLLFPMKSKKDVLEDYIDAVLTNNEYSSPEKKCIAYFCNIIGELYNVFGQKPLRDEIEESDRKRYREYAAVFCKKAYKLICGIVESKSDSAPIPEFFATYVRNYGTTLERFKDDTIKEDGTIVRPEDMYLKAIAIKPTDYLAYQTYAAITLKRILVYLNKTSYLIDREFHRFTDEEIEAMAENQSGKRIRTDVLPYLKILQHGFPTRIVGYSLEYISYNILFASTSDKDIRLRVYYKKEAERVGAILDVLDPEKRNKYTLWPYEEP
ncbi:MAG: hypothetical protein FWH17_01680 [Oscillospiraceae bacterium]|nr:hypothetical protein [Oscillospiraceae bacterium]